MYHFFIDKEKWVITPIWLKIKNYEKSKTWCKPICVETPATGACMYSYFNMSSKLKDWITHIEIELRKGGFVYSTCFLTLGPSEAVSMLETGR